MKILHLTSEQAKIVSTAVSYLITEGKEQLRNDMPDRERENLQWHINNFEKLQSEIQKQLKVFQKGSGNNEKNFNYIVIGKRYLSKFEPEVEYVIAGFNHYVNAEAFVNTFTEENRKRMEIRKVQ